MNRRAFFLGLVSSDLFGKKRPIHAKKVQHHRQKVPELAAIECTSPSVRGVILNDRYTTQGRIERSLRWENITNAVEKKYRIPSGYLLGMIAQESMGDPTLPNLGGDGGLGLIHMQPLLASQYGLKMITYSRRLRDFHQGKKIEELLDKKNRDLVEIAKYDERLHPVKNVDAAARMLKDHYQRTGSWHLALERYAGRKTYDSQVTRFALLSNNLNYRRKLEREFDERNKSILVNGQPLTFRKYLSIAHNMNNCQFELQKYSLDR